MVNKDETVANVTKRPAVLVAGDRSDYVAGETTVTDDLRAAGSSKLEWRGASK